MKLDRIVVGVDGSANSLAAVEWAAGLAQLTGAEIVAVHALGLLDQLEGDRPVPAQPHRDEIRQLFEHEWCKPLDRTALRSRRLMRDGNPVDVLLAVGDHETADLLVVGSRGLGGHLLLGSTSSQIAQNSSRPVIIVPSAGGPERSTGPDLC